MKRLLSVLILLWCHVAIAQFMSAHRLALRARAATVATPMPWASQSNLIFYARSDSVVQTNGFVIGMHDLHNSYNTVNPDGVTNDIFADPSLTTNVFAINDFQGNVSIEWPWQAIEVAPRTSLEQMTNAGVVWSSTVNFTTFAVASFADYGNLIDIRSWGFPGLGVSSTRQLGAALTYNGNVPINKSFFIVSSGGSHLYTDVNGNIVDNAATGATGATGITIGDGFAGALYQIGVINRALTTNEMNELGAWLSSNANVRTNYTDSLVAFGDSMTAGIGSTNLQSWPYQYYEARPDFLVYNLASSGARIPTSGANPGLDAFYNPAMSNRFVMQMGVNNMLNGDTATTIYTDLTNYLAARQTSHPNWYLLPVTLANTGSGTPSVITNYNNMIRAGTNDGIYTHISDPGWQSPVETRLDDASNPTYFFTDGLHLVNAGYAVQMQHATNAVLNGGR